MQIKNCFLWVAGFALGSVLLAMPLFSQTSFTLSGKVFNGNTGNETTPISGVNVTLWGANDSGVKISPSITSSTTDANGWYGLTFLMRGNIYDYYIIEETDPGGYYSVDATSVSGTKLSNNMIQYTFNGLSGTTTGNKFWDKPNAPDINVQGNGISIPDGDVTPVTADGTDFGLTYLGGRDSMGFTVKNTGTAVLNLTGVTLSGSGDFSVHKTPALTVAVGDQTYFNLYFMPTAAGVRKATVNIGNNTTAKNPYDFAIQGTGAALAPDIDVQGNGISIPDGDVTPVTADGTDFGLTYLGGLDSSVFIVKNTGSAVLNLSGVTLTGSGDFSVYKIPALSVAVGDQTYINIHFVPTAVGMRSATVNIVNNTTAKNPYDFVIQGTGAGNGQDLGSIRIWKKAKHPNPPFYFTGDLGAFSLFNPYDSAIDFSGIPSGTYSITELAQPGWNLDNIQINDPSGGSTADVPTATAHIHVDGNEQINIYFSNTKGGEQTYDFGDAPDPGYPTLLTNNGARHIIKQGFFLGTAIDDETDGQPSTWADGDDTHHINDEDGILMSPFIGIGQSVPIKINASAAGFVNAWIDFDANSSWGDAGEHILSAMPVNAGTNTFTINVPSGLKENPTYARFRFSSVAQLSYDGSAPDGEVEDYVIELKSEQIGSVKVIKEATPEDNTTFWMCATMKNAFFNIYCFPLHDPSDNSFVFLNPGDITEISESSVAGWTLDGINITGDTDNGSTINLATGTVILDFDTGENIVITFINKKNDDNPPPPVKWPQIPKKKGDSDHPDCFWGWDEPSVYSQVIAADDWYSGDERPVTDIHW